jgi:hypothetical protein
MITAAIATMATVDNAATITRVSLSYRLLVKTFRVSSCVRSRETLTQITVDSADPTRISPALSCASGHETLGQCSGMTPEAFQVVRRIRSARRKPTCDVQPAVISRNLGVDQVFAVLHGNPVAT